MIAKIGKMMTKREDKSFSYEELAAMLKTSPEALETFEGTYKGRYWTAEICPKTSCSGTLPPSRLCSTRKYRLHGKSKRLSTVS